jgi:hypothetical protein
VIQFDREASQTRDYCVEKERDATRGSPRFLTAQRTLVRNDNQTAPLPKPRASTLNLLILCVWVANSSPRWLSSGLDEIGLSDRILW